ncbi:MAG: hypothetical protein OXC61_03125 [Flavobacteriaceae bacterium]|nr:hypothetical protein [Flavobacteriaceae bacterium]
MDKKREQYRTALKALNAGISKTRGPKPIDQVQQSIGKLSEKYRPIAHHFEVPVIPKENRSHAQEIRIENKPAYQHREEMMGMYVIRSSHKNWPIGRRVKTYHGLNEMEQTFRSLKSD